MRNRWRLLCLLLVFLAMVGAAAGAETSAQVSAQPGRVFLWSSQGPVAVERISAAEAGPLEPETLLQELLEGPTAQERQKGLWTAIPQGTNLVDVLEGAGGRLTVRLAVPPQALQSLHHEPFEIMVNQIGNTLMPLDWRDLRIYVRDPESGSFLALADFLPPVTVPFKPSVLTGESAADSPAATGQPPAPGQGQPDGALSDKTVYVSAGHGWQWVYSYSAGGERWKTQRPPYPASASYDGPIIEDHNNAEAVNQYLLQYLWNAGAMVWPARERDINAAQTIVDDFSDTGFSASSGWTVADGGYEDQHHEAQTVTGQPTDSATWTATLPEDGRYAVYVWFRSVSNPTDDAQYTVHHGGGETRVTVDQQHHGYTWHYIGTYGFLADEEARITLTNQSSSAGRTVVADAVRLGGGTFDDLEGIDTGAEVPPYKPWWEVASFYYTQRMGMDAAYGDVTARPVYARWEHAGTEDDAVYISWHTNGATGYQDWASGTETYAHNGEGLPRTEGSLELRQAIHTEVVHDIRAGWDASWVDRGEKLKNLGELRLLWDDEPSRRMPGALIEIGFHDHPGDTDALKEPTYNQLVARAVYQGIVKYFERRDGLDLTLLPEPPTRLIVENTGGGSVRVSWDPPPTDSQGLAGDPPSGYRVYTSTNGIGWSDGIPVSSGTEVLLSGLAAEEPLFVRVTSTNAGGESFPTETLAARVGDRAEVLLVNGFDRLNRTMVLHENDPEEGWNARMLLDRMNRYDYVIQHGETIGHAFDSASNEAVQSGSVVLGDYTIVDWILGEESVDDETLNGNERSLLRVFLSGGGALFISGSEIGYHLEGLNADPGFYNGVLRADYLGDDADTYQVSGVSGPFAGLSFSFDALGMYDADYPDLLQPCGGAEEALRYQGGSGGAAAVQYANGCERVVTFGFPFETIRPSQRGAVMSAVMGFLDECMDPTVDTTIDSPAYGSVHATLPAFRGGAYARQTVPDGVQITLQQVSSGEYWDGTSWVTSERWLDASGAETWSYSLPATLPDGDYGLRARARAGDVLDTSPAEVVFTYDTTAPAPTALITPTGGVTIAALPELLLDWTEVGPDGGSDLSYQVELDGERWSTTVSFYTIPNVAEGAHTWRVQVQDAAGNASDWTPQGTFTVSRVHVWLPLVLRDLTGAPSTCSNVILNGGFESDAGWLFNNRAGFAAENARTGDRSGRIGILPDEPATGLEATNWSSARQVVTLPSGSRATLRLWVYPILEGNDANDLHYISLRDQSNVLHHLELATSDAREWRQGEYDLTEYTGQTVTIYLGVQYDGDDQTPALYVDDVELEVCP